MFMLSDYLLPLGRAYLGYHPDVKEQVMAKLKAKVTANKQFEETEMQQAFIVNANSIGYTFKEEECGERIIRSFFAATSAHLSDIKVSDPNVATAMVLTDVAGKFKFAAIVEFHENEENPDDPGNWTYTMTLNEQDLLDLEKEKEVRRTLYGEDAFKATFDRVSYDVGGVEFELDRYMYDACLLTIDTLVQILDREAIDGQVVDVVMPGYFTASVEVKNGEKVFAIVPDGSMKELIKSDVRLEK